MGNLLKSHHEEDLIVQLVTLSNDTVSTEQAYDIMMKTSCRFYVDQAGELIGLFKRFTELDVNKLGKLSNYEFLSMNELRFNPFRPRLHLAIPFKPEEFIRNNSVKKDVADSFDKHTVDPQILENPQKIAPDPGDPNSIDLVSYIDFSLFCQYLAVFSPRATNDTKFNCKEYSVVFKLFDLDEDGQLGESDLSSSLRTLVAANLTADEIKEAVDHIFTENGKENERQLTREDFQKSLWMTDFHQKLSIYFA